MISVSILSVIFSIFFDSLSVHIFWVNDGEVNIGRVLPEGNKLRVEIRDLEIACAEAIREDDSLPQRHPDSPREKGMTAMIFVTVVSPFSPFVPYTIE